MAPRGRTYSEVIHHLALNASKWQHWRPIFKVHQTWLADLSRQEALRPVSSRHLLASVSIVVCCTYVCLHVSFVEYFESVANILHKCTPEKSTKIRPSGSAFGTNNNILLVLKSAVTGLLLAQCHSLRALYGVRPFPSPQGLRHPQYLRSSFPNMAYTFAERELWGGHVVVKIPNELLDAR